MNFKRHYNLYKSGKLWYVAAISTLLLLSMMSKTSYADVQLDTQNQVTEQFSQTNTNPQIRCR